MQNQQNNYQYPAPSNNGQYYQQQPQPVQGTNALAISSLVCGIIGWIIPILFALLAIIFGHVARSQIKRSGQSGAGLALAGLILGYIQFVIMSIGILAAIALPAYHDYVIRSKWVEADVYLVQARDKLAKRIAADKDNSIIINISAEEMNIPGMEKHWNEFERYTASNERQHRLGVPIRTTNETKPDAEIMHNRRQHYLFVSRLKTPFRQHNPTVKRPSESFQTAFLHPAQTMPDPASFPDSEYCADQTIFSADTGYGARFPAAG